MPKSTDPDVVLLDALADPARLAIVRQLSTDGQVCASALAGGGTRRDRGSRNHPTQLQ